MADLWHDRYDHLSTSFMAQNARIPEKKSSESYFQTLTLSIAAIILFSQ